MPSTDWFKQTRTHIPESRSKYPMMAFRLPNEAARVELVAAAEAANESVSLFIRKAIGLRLEQIVREGDSIH